MAAPSSTATTTPDDTLEVAVFQAYLDPLLKKHGSSELIVYEDLIKSWSSANGTLGKHANNDQPTDVIESTVSRSHIHSFFLCGVFLS